MKKLFILSLLLAFFAGSVYAEMGGTAFSQDSNWDEHANYIYAYNATSTDITSNAVVVLDTTNISASTTGIARIRITTTTTEGDYTFLGVTDEVIEATTNGRVCVRGPHLAIFSTNAGGLNAGGEISVPAGATLTTAGVAGALELVDGGSGATPPIVAVAIAQNQTQDESVSGKRPQDGTPPNLLWVWIR